MTGLHHLDISTYYGNCVQLKYNRLDARATPSKRSPIQERLSTLLESELQSCPSGRSQLPSGRSLEKIVPDSI